MISPKITIISGSSFFLGKSFDPNDCSGVGQCFLLDKVKAPHFWAKFTSYVTLEGAIKSFISNDVVQNGCAIECSEIFTSLFSSAVVQCNV